MSAAVVVAWGGNSLLDVGSPPTVVGRSAVTACAVRRPAMIELGAGLEQNAHRAGQSVDLRELSHAIALLARFPSASAGA